MEQASNNMSDFNKLYPHYDGTPRTDRNTHGVEEFSCWMVPHDVTKWLERSRRANIKARWEMRRVMRLFHFAVQSDSPFVGCSSVYERYLQGLKK